jgi:hypothetical protein
MLYAWVCRFCGIGNIFENIFTIQNAQNVFIFLTEPSRGQRNKEVRDQLGEEIRSHNLQPTESGSDVAHRSGDLATENGSTHSDFIEFFLDFSNSFL